MTDDFSNLFSPRVEAIQEGFRQVMWAAQQAAQQLAIVFDRVNARLRADRCVALLPPSWLDVSAQPKRDRWGGRRLRRARRQRIARNARRRLVRHFLAVVDAPPAYYVGLAMPRPFVPQVIP